MAQETAWLVGSFSRPSERLVFPGHCFVSKLPFSSENAWRSQGGTDNKHPDRALPRKLEIGLPSPASEVNRIVLYGVFGISEASPKSTNGRVGATIHLQNRDDSVFQLDCIEGRHFSDSRLLDLPRRVNGDGTELELVGTVSYRGIEHRVDRLCLELPRPVVATSIQFHSGQGPTSFVIFDCFAEATPSAGCPFHSHQGGISLSEIPSIIRVGELNRWEMAIDQLSNALLRGTDLDEARSQALTFIAVLTAAALEKGADRTMHRVQLDTARLLDKQESVEEVMTIAMEVIERIAKPLFGEIRSPSAHLVQRSLAYVERNFARKLDDGVIADHLGLSTSHFRFLFREATGQPFHRYLISMRLEQARRLLAEGSTHVSEVADAVGFRSTSHFSRAFSRRFGMSPVEVRKQVAIQT